MCGGLLLCAGFSGEPLRAAESDPHDEEFRERIVVTASASEEPVTEAIPSVGVLTAAEIERSAFTMLDDHLRQIPGFSLFRRSSSLSAHPTTQGVSLRGIGPSGTSRSLVLFDGTPLNDPFGGWVYWNRLPTLALRAVEVSAGSTSPLYGSAAMGGTIQILARRPEAGVLEASVAAGTEDTVDAEFFASSRGAEWGHVVAGRVFSTDGFFIVDKDVRGEIDAPASLKFGSFFGRVHHGRNFAGVNLYREERGNGTQIQENNSRIALFEAGHEGESWEWRLFWQSQHFESTFSRVLADRSEEFLTAEQSFPSTGAGASLAWSNERGLRVGADWRRASWERRDQDLVGLFVQGDARVHPRLDLLLGARLDVWENESTQSTVNPRAGILWRLSEKVNVRGSVYRGFRAPTLNELYRPFRVGNVETLANAALSEEHLWGAETGVDFHPARPAWMRVNVFYNSLRDPVGNQTLSVSATGVLRQRQNLGRATIRGAEAEGRLHLGPAWRLRAGYLFSDAIVEETGLRLPQVPRHQGSFSVTYLGWIEATLEGRASSNQYEDDLNVLDLGSYAIVNLSLRRRLHARATLFLEAENILDETYAVGRLPVERLGTPRLVRGGIRMRFR